MDRNYNDKEARDFIRNTLDQDCEQNPHIFSTDTWDVRKIVKKILITRGAPRIFKIEEFIPTQLLVRKKDFAVLETIAVQVRVKDTNKKKISDLIHVGLSTSAIPLSEMSKILSAEGEPPDWIFEEPNKVFLVLNSVLPVDSRSGVIAIDQSRAKVQISPMATEGCHRKEKEIKGCYLDFTQVNKMKKFLNYIIWKYNIPIPNVEIVGPE